MQDEMHGLESIKTAADHGLPAALAELGHYLMMTAAQEHEQQAVEMWKSGLLSTCVR